MHVVRHRENRKFKPDQQDRDFPAGGAVLGLIGGRQQAILAMTAAGLIISVAHAALRQPIYSVRTVLEIGALTGPDGQRWVETPEIVSKKITEAYAPLAWIETRASDALLDEETPQITGKATRNTNIVILDTAATEREIAAHKSLQDRIFTRLKGDHDRIFDVRKSGLEAERQSARKAVEQLSDQSDLVQELAPINTEIRQIEAKLSALEDERQFGVTLKDFQSQIAVADNRLKDLAQASALLESTIQQKDVQAQQARTKLVRLDADLESHKQNRQVAARNTATGSEAMTLMLLDAQNGQLAEERDKLEAFVTVDAPIERSRMEHELASNQREQDIQKLAMEKARAALEKRQIERQQDITSLKPGLIGLQAKLENAKASRERTLAVESAKLRDLEERLKNMAVTRRLFAPQAPFERADLPAAVIIPAGALAGLLLSLAYAFAAHIFSLARASDRRPHIRHIEPGMASLEPDRDSGEDARPQYASYGAAKPLPM